MSEESGERAVLKHIGTQTLNTPRLTLRRFTEDDVPCLYVRDFKG